MLICVKIGFRVSKCVKGDWFWKCLGRGALIMGKIKEKFKQLKKSGKSAFIPYITFGFPDMKTFSRTAVSLDECGVDFIEIGFPFSDPIADGPVIQHSSKIALDKGADLPSLYAWLKKYKSRIKTPLILMCYYNSVYSLGVNRFLKKFSGVLDGIIIPDLLAEEAGEFVSLAKKYGIDTVFFVTPTTENKRLPLIDRCSTGFIYYISVTGVTGMRKDISRNTLSDLKRIRKSSTSPVCIGFGVSTRRQVKALKKDFDGVIVGSAIIKQIDGLYKSKGFVRKFKEFILWLNA